MSAISPADRSAMTSRILHVDDDPEFGDLTALFLERENELFEVETVTGADEGLDRLATAEFDCIVSDYDMPGRNGIEFLEAVRETHPDLPFILFTGKGSEEVASEAISADVTEYLQKEGGTDQYTVLANRITNVTEHYYSRQLLERSERQLREIIDSLSHFLYIVDEDGEYVLANEALASFHGMTAEEIEGVNVADTLGETVLTQFRENVATALDAGDRTQFPEMEVRNDGGNTRIFEPRLLPYDLEGTEKRAVLGISDDVTDRVERERELERHEAYLKESSDIIAVLDAAGRVNYQSPSVTRILGYDSTGLLGRVGFQFVHPDDVDAVTEAFATLVADPGGSVTVECRFRTADDEWRWLEIHGRNLLDHPVIEGIVTNNRDITERKQREQELERAGDLLTKTERIADVGGWEIDTETMEVFWTEHLYDLLRLECDEAPSLETALDIFHEADRSVVENAVESALDGGDPFDVEVRSRQPDGELRWLRVQGVPGIENGEVVTLRGAVQDITERREREESLTQARAEYEELINGMNDTVWVLDAEGNFLAVNDAAAETTGYSRAELLDMTVHDIDVGFSADGLARLLNEEIPRDGVRVIETVHESRDGERFPVEISSSLISSRDETAVLGIGRDISNRKEHEQQLEAFASIVSHDLRNPLNVAEGWLELARQEADSDYLDGVASAHERMSALIDDLLTLARDGEQLGALEPVALADLAESCWRHVSTADSSLVVDADPSLVVDADRSRLQQLLENLMRNAVEHGGPNVTVTVGELDDGFYVEDDGDGIPKTDAETLFTFGYSTAEDGTGFGLSIVKQIADAHGWTVCLAESADGGARLEVSGVTRTD